MHRVIIENLGGAAGTIVAECPGFNAAYHLATQIANCPLCRGSIKIYFEDELLSMWEKKV